jgi:hypothetical protein
MTVLSEGYFNKYIFPRSDVTRSLWKTMELAVQRDPSVKRSALFLAIVLIIVLGIPNVVVSLHVIIDIAFG